MGKMGNLRSLQAFNMSDDLARCITKVALSLLNQDREKPFRVLEYSCRNSIFIRALRDGLYNHCNSIDVVGSAKESQTSLIDSPSSSASHSLPVNLMDTDFLQFLDDSMGSTQRYDLVIGNPSYYVRYQSLSDAQRNTLLRIISMNRMKASRRMLSNLWIVLTAACMNLLEDGGVLAFLLPMELLSSPDAAILRLILMESTDSLYLLTFSRFMFKELGQELVIVVGRKKKDAEDICKLSVATVTPEALKNHEDPDLRIASYVMNSSFLNTWNYFSLDQSELVLVNMVENDLLFYCFSDIAIITKGVSTGSDSFFTVSGQTVKEYDLLPISCPALTDAQDSKGIFYEKSEWEENNAQGRKSYLVEYGEGQSLSDGQRNYLRYGETQGCLKNRCCSLKHAPRDSSGGKATAGDALFPSFIYSAPRLIINSASVVPTDAFLRIQLEDGVETDSLIIAFYNSLTFALVELYGRDKNGGALEMTPAELGNLRLLYHYINSDLIKDGIALLDQKIRNCEDPETILDFADSLYMSVNPYITIATLRTARMIWRKLRNRRLGKSKIK